MGLLAIGYEELGFVRIGSRIGHRHHPSGVELGSEERATGRDKRGRLDPVWTLTEKEGESSSHHPFPPVMALAAHFDGGSDFVLERFSPERLATFASTGRITRLDHECLDVTMKNAAVVIVGGTKGEKVLQSGSIKGRNTSRSV